MKLGTKIDLVLLFSIAVVLTVGFWVIDAIESKNIKNEVINNNNTVTDLVRQDIERSYAQILRHQKSLQAAVDTLSSQLKGVDYIEISSESGAIIATSRPVAESQENDIRLAAIKEVVQTGEHVSRTNTKDNYYELEHFTPLFGRNNVINVVEIDVNTRSKSAQDVAEAKKILETASTQAILNIQLISTAIEDESNYIQKVIDEVGRFGKDDQSDEFGFFHGLIVYDDNLNIIASTESEKDESHEKMSEYVQARHEILSGEKQSIQYDKMDNGHSVVVFVKPIEIKSEQGPQVVGILESHILKSTYEDRIKGFRSRMLGIGIIFAATLVLVISVILDRQVVGPIRRYSLVARKIADGDLNQKVEYTSNDEIGQFGNVFNSMVANLREIDRMKSDFISVAAHQLRTPLSGVKWVLKLFLDGDVGVISDEQKAILKRGYETNEKMISLVNDLLNVSRIENGKFGYNFEKNNFMELLRMVIENTALPSKERNVEIQFTNKAGEVPEFVFDKEKLLVAIQNVIDNAMKYTLPGGKVTVVIEKKGDYLSIKVSDTGVGIPKDDLPKLFSKFFRATNVIHLETDGSGLGLFIVKSIVVRHGGQIWVDSVEGKGTTFVIMVPVLAELIPKEE